MLNSRGRKNRVGVAETERNAAMARRLAHEVTEELREALLDDGEDLGSAFDRMDVDRNGYLTAVEFMRGLR